MLSRACSTISRPPFPQNYHTKRRPPSQHITFLTTSPQRGPYLYVVILVNFLAIVPLAAVLPHHAPQFRFHVISIIMYKLLYITISTKTLDNSSVSSPLNNTPHALEANRRKQKHVSQSSQKQENNSTVLLYRPNYLHLSVVGAIHTPFPYHADPATLDLKISASTRGVQSSAQHEDEPSLLAALLGKNHTQDRKNKLNLPPTKLRRQAGVK